jgi:hypothetical protein
VGKPRRKSGWRQTQPDPAVIGPRLREFGFIGSETNPISVRASFDAEGRPRRVHARYADGWTCTLHLSTDRSYSISQSLRMRVTGKAVLA